VSAGRGGRAQNFLKGLVIVCFGCTPTGGKLLSHRLILILNLGYESYNNIQIFGKEFESEVLKFFQCPSDSQKKFVVEV